MEGGISKVNTKKIIVFVLLALFVVSALLTTVMVKQERVEKSHLLSAEDLRAKTYAQITEESYSTQSEYVRFNAFFTRDLDGDGYAEKISGTCRELGKTDTLYIDVNVLTKGSLKNGIIRINNKNFTWKTATLADTVVKENYLGDTSTIFLKDEVPCGSQKMMWGEVRSAIGRNIENYSQINSITLTGTHVTEDGVETPIEKTVDLTVDWYGDIKAQIALKSIEKIKNVRTSQNGVELTIDVVTSESRGKLLLKENVTKLTIPEFNGYKPISVESSAKRDYDEATGVLTLYRGAVLEEDGNIKSSVSRYNTYELKITYPKEAYQIGNETIEYKVPIETYYVGYNNKSKEIQEELNYSEGELKSNVAKEIIAFVQNVPSGYVYDFQIRVYNPEMSSPVLKTKPLKIYNKEVEDTEDDCYIVNWHFDRGSKGTVTSTVMREDPNKYTDKFLNSSSSYIDMEDYIGNVGIYFSGAKWCLGESGYIKVYNDETDELIHTFTAEEYENCNKVNPYLYDNEIRHIRVETSESRLNSSLDVYHIKEIHDKSLTDDMSLEEFSELRYIYSHLRGTVYIEEDGGESSVDRVNNVRYENRKTIATIQVEKYRDTFVTTKGSQVLQLEIKAESESIFYEEWKNGQFLVKLPSGIIGVEDLDIKVLSNQIEIIGYDLYKEEENYFIKVITKNLTNERPTVKININAKITPNPGIPTSSGSIALYAYNEIASEYQNKTNDNYDVNGNCNTAEIIGYSSTGISFIAPTTIVTF